MAMHEKKPGEISPGQKRKPAHIGPAGLNPIFNIPGVSDRAAAARDNTRARNCPQSPQRGGVSAPAGKGVTMVCFPNHLFSLHFIILSTIHS
jgi:hypothetical protein